MQYIIILQLGCCLVPSNNPIRFDKRFRSRENQTRPPLLLLHVCMFSCGLQLVHLSLQHLHVCLFCSFGSRVTQHLVVELFGNSRFLVLCPLTSRSHGTHSHGPTVDGNSQVGKIQEISGLRQPSVN